MAEPWLDVVERVTEVFATAQFEACARRTGFVRRTSKLTGKVFVALVRWGRGVHARPLWGNWQPKRRSCPRRWPFHPQPSSNG
jgi:hypothetical protein